MLGELFDPSINLFIRFFLFVKFKYHLTFRLSAEGRLLGWNVPPDEIRHIPEHWLQFQEPPESMHYLLAMLYIFFTIMSLTGNGLVIWVFTA